MRTVPTKVAEPGVTLKAPRSPDCTAQILTTAASMARTLRETMDWIAVIRCAEASTTSLVW
ncbi:hypothetical protein D3C71_2075130 [compost metagenome]